MTEAEAETQESLRSIVIHDAGFSLGICVPQEQSASSEDTRAECTTYRLTEIGTTFNLRGNFCDRRRREPLREVWGHALSPPPQINQILKALKRHLQHSQVESCVKKVPKFENFFLTLTKRALSSAVI